MEREKAVDSKTSSIKRWVLLSQFNKVGLPQLLANYICFQETLFKNRVLNFKSIDLWGRGSAFGGIAPPCSPQLRTCYNDYYH